MAAHPGHDLSSLPAREPEPAWAPCSHGAERLVERLSPVARAPFPVAPSLLQPRPRRAWDRQAMRNRRTLRPVKSKTKLRPLIPTLSGAIPECRSLRPVLLRPRRVEQRRPVKDLPRRADEHPASHELSHRSPALHPCLRSHFPFCGRSSNPRRDLSCLRKRGPGGRLALDSVRVNQRKSRFTLAGR